MGLTVRHVEVVRKVACVQPHGLSTRDRHPRFILPSHPRPRPPTVLFANPLFLLRDGFARSSALKLRVLPLLSITIIFDFIKMTRSKL